MLPTEPGDTSVLAALFGHNTWANLQLLEFCAGLRAAEHRTQIAAILTQLGIPPPALSGRAYMRATGEFHEFA